MSYQLPSRPRPKSIHFDGDSLFSRGNNNLAQAYESPIAAYNAITGVRPPMFFYAISGRSITQLIAEFPTKVQPNVSPRDIIVMNELTNELQTVQDVNAVYATLQSYCAMVRALNCKIVIATCTARGTGYANFETDRLALNILIRNGYATFADGLADTGGLTEFNSVAATANATYYNADTLHFTTSGYTLYGQTFSPIIQPLI